MNRDRELLQLGTKPVRTIAAAAGLTLAGYRHRLWRMGLSADREATRQGGMSVKDVAQALGVNRATVYRWTERKWLRPTYGYALTAKRRSYSADDVSAFLATVGGLIDAITPLPIWREEYAAAQAALRARFIRGDRLMQLMLRPAQQLAWLRRKHGFPAPALRLGAYGDYYERSAVREWLSTHPQYATRQLRQEVIEQESSQ